MSRKKILNNEVQPDVVTTVLQSFWSEEESAHFTKKYFNSSLVFKNPLENNILDNTCEVKFINIFYPVNTYLNLPFSVVNSNGGGVR